MLLSFAACANDTGTTPPPVKENETTAATTPSETTAPAEPETTIPPETGPTPNIPEVGDKYKGTELVFLHRGTDNAHYNEPWIFAEQITGDTLNDEIYRRNSYIEEKYGITIKQEINSAVHTQVDLAMSSQDDIYDVAYPQVNKVSSSILKGSFYNLAEMPYIDYDMPWWDSNCVEATTYNGQFYLAICDISLGLTRSARGMIFNRDLIRHYQLEDPYELVKNNQWTLDKLAHMIQSSSEDLDGDQQWTDEDRYGLLSEGSTNVSHFVTGAGEPIFVTHQDGSITIDVFNERTMGIIDTIRSFLIDPTISRNYSELTPDGDRHVYGRRLFSADKFLFTQAGLSLFDEFAANNMESEYGIVPNPKVSADQENYAHRPDRNSTGLVIPATNQQEDLERIAILIDDMAYMSSKTVLPAYYETIINLRRARVPEMGEMVDLIKNSIYYDISFIHDMSWTDGLKQGYETGVYASTFTRYNRVVENSIKQLIKKLEALN